MSNVHSSVMFSSSAIAEEGAPFLIIDELQRENFVPGGRFGPSSQWSLC